MPSAEFAALIRSSGQAPYDLVELDLPNPTGGTNTWRIVSASDVFAHLRLSVDALPLVHEVGGVSGRIDPEKVGTWRGVLTIKCRDWPDYPEAFPSGCVATTGGSFFERLLLAYPAWHRSPVRVRLGFDHPTMDTLAKTEVVFRGVLEDVSYSGENEVTLAVGDVSPLRDVQVPAGVGDDQVLAEAVTATQRYFKVTDSSQFSDPKTWPTVDMLPPVLVLEPETGDEERVAISHIEDSPATGVPLGALVACANYLSDSEGFGAGSWPSTGATWTRTPAKTAGPWGSDNGTELETATNDELYQDTGKAWGDGSGGCFAVWLREHPDYPGQVVTIGLRDALGDLVTQAVTTTPYWRRYFVSNSGSGAVSTFIVFLRVAGVAKFYAAQASFTWESGTSAGVTLRPYVPGTGTAAGAYAGRGVYGTTARTHALSDPVTEWAIWRRYGAASDSAAEGLHPLWIGLDLLARAYLPAAWTDADTIFETFGAEVDIKPGDKFKRVLREPKDVGDLVGEVQGSYLCNFWAHRLGYLVCRLAWRPRTLLAFPLVTREADLVQASRGGSSVEVSTNSKSRITAVIVCWDLAQDADGRDLEGDRPDDYLHKNMIVDVTPGTVGDDFRSWSPKIICSPWIYRVGEAVNLAGRTLSRYRRGARTLKCRIGFHRYEDVELGTVVQVEHTRLVGAVSGAVAPARPLFQLVEVAYGSRAAHLDCRLLEATGGRYAHITPNLDPRDGVSPFPDYDASPPEWRDYYGYFADVALTLGVANDPPSLIL